MKDCSRCGFNDEDYGCTCPIENKKPENKLKLFHCYVCGELNDCDKGSFVVSLTGTYSGEPKKVIICKDCVNRIVAKIKQEKQKVRE